MSKVLDQRSFVGSHVGSSSSSSSSSSIAELVGRGGLSMGGLGGTSQLTASHLQHHHHQNNGVGLDHHHHNTALTKMGITNDIAKSLPPDTTIALGGDNPPKKETGPEPIKQSLLVHIASLILYGCQALPIRLKILLDRLLSLLNHDEVMQLLSGFSWTYEDYERGYKLQDRSGQVLHSWHMMSPEEESLVLRQFLRFSETKDVAQQLLKQQPSQREQPSRDTASDPKDSIRESLSVRSDLQTQRDTVRNELQTQRDTIKDALSLSPRQSDSRSITRETNDSLRETLRLRDSRELVDESRKPMRSYMDHAGEPKLHVKDSSELFRDSRDPLREPIRPHKESRDLIRESRDSTREPREPLRELREPLRDIKESTKEYYGNQTPNFPRGEPPSYSSSTEAMKALDPQIKKFLERTNMLFNPFMQGGSGDLLRPPPPSSHLGLPAAPPQMSSANLASNFLGAAQSSLATSLLMNQQLSSMLRLPVPPVSLPNLSQTSTLPSSISSSTSPGIGVTPLNHLKNLQPFDFRKSSHSPKSASSGPHSGVGAADFSGAGDIGRPSFSTGSGITGSGITGSGITGSGITGLPPTSSQHSPPAPPPSNNSLHSSYANENSDITSSISGATSTALNLSTTSATTSSTTPTTASNRLDRLEHSPGELSSAIRERTSWNPINMATTLINPVTGKKRVQCTVCLKTFCDKGALKIHFSAVHLREMHKCTVEGCTMMFSSRRSRNRHSANPSPKLHTPHVRRKISPHDGRSALSTSPLLGGFRPPSYQVRPGFPPLGAFPPPFGTINPLTGLPFIPPPSPDDLNRNRLDMHHRSLEMQYGMGKHPLDFSKDQGRPLDNGGFSASMSHFYNDKTIDDDQIKMEVEGTVEDLDDSMSVDTQSLRGDASSPSSSKRKRKNQNPIKNFAFRLEDDDLISTDDEYDDDDIDAKDSDEDKNIDKELDAMSDCDDEDTKGEQKDGTSDCDKSKNDGSNANVTSSSNDEAVDTSSALQHLENLSKNHFPSSLSANITDSFDQQIPPATSPTPSDHDSDRESIAALENEENFHVGSDGFLSNTNIPIDKENPRQCVACGKIFQNHFTVKTHYQNVHLKLMHTCTVTGCNAAFPSKRSRDRHASNLTLHRKLLSTSTSQPSFPGLGFPGLPFNPIINPELFARLYTESSALQLNSSNPTLGASTGDPPPVAHPPPHLFFQNLLPHLAANNNFQNLGLQDLPGNRSNNFQNLGLQELPGNRSPQSTTQSINQNLPRSQSPSQNQTSDKPPIVESEQDTSNRSSPVREGEDQIDWIYNLEDDLPSPDRDGNMPCKFCLKAFGDGVELKNHYDEVHRGELFKCTVSGCNKLFSSRRKRNNHAINSELHRHIESIQGRESEHCQTDRSTPEQETFA